MLFSKKQTQKSLFTRESPLLVRTGVKVILTFLIGIVISFLAVVLARQQYIDSLTNRTETLSSLLDSAKIKSLIQDDTSAKQNELYIKRQLQRARSVNVDVNYLYVLAETVNRVPFYVVDSEPIGSDTYKRRGEPVRGASSALLASFQTSIPHVREPLSNGSDAAVSAVSPVYDLTGKQIAVVGMDIRSTTYYSLLTAAILLPLLGAALVSAVFLMTDAVRRRRQESIRMRSELVSIASHELRTPLTGIRWGEESLLQKDLPPESREVLQSMYESTIRLQESIEDILQLANWQAGRTQELVRTTADMTETLSAIFATQKLPAAQKNITLEFAPKWPKKLLITCDAQRMKRVFNNLLSNAIKYSNPNSVVVVKYQKVDGKHLITISDQGIGIPSGEQEKVFAGFYRASNAAKHETNGTGMGLYMSRNTIEQHGGKLWLTSKEGKSTTVYIQLP